MSNPKTITWTDPTTDVNGDPLTSANAITGYVIGIGTVSGTYTQLITVPGATTASEALSAITPTLVPGSYFAAVKAVSLAGDSAWSNEAPFTIAAPAVPAAPTGFTVA